VYVSILVLHLDAPIIHTAAVMLPGASNVM
jgi:hypothetical protein